MKNASSDVTTVPLKFLPNRIERLYRGGSGIDHLRGAKHPEDTNCPEDWVASCVEANNRGGHRPGYGVSTVIDDDGAAILFPDLLKCHPNELLGKNHVSRFGAHTGVLTKFLDSAIRLPLQVHPDRAMAKKYLDSPYGKTEAWIVLSTRDIDGERPSILLGFNDTLDADVFRQESFAGEYATGLAMLHKIEVKAGDVFVVYGRMPHAIGAGVTMVEVMEPTDITINPERLCDGKEIAPERRFARLPPNNALAIFDYTPSGYDDVLKRCVPRTEIIEKNDSREHCRIIPGSEVEYFEVQRLTVSGEWNMQFRERTFRIALVTKGSAVIHTKGRTMTVNAGDGLFFPYAMSGCRIAGEAEIHFVLPPTPEKEPS